MSSTTDTRLATYGTLAPGRANAGQLSMLEGRWRTGTVRGRLVETGWGAKMGYPGIVMDAAGDPVEVHLFESPDLPDHWARLDAFEGDGYRRVETTVDTREGTVTAWIFEVVT